MTMTNLEWIAKKDIRAGNAIRCSDFGNWMAKNHFGEDVDYWFVKWLDMEYVEPILDDAEKRYLKGVIRPFRDEIKAIEKDNYLANESERIYFFTKKGELFYLKSFKAGAMYKGMKPKKAYTLEELGL